LMMTENPIIHWLKDRIQKRNRGNNILICGEPGSGKSYRGLRIGELLDFNGFGIIKVLWSALEVVTYIDDGKIKQGDAIDWEENFGAEASEWYTQSNNAIKRTMQVMRRKRFTFIMNLPSIKDLDPKLRHLFHVYIEPISFDERLNGYWCIVMRIQHNPRLGKTYFKYFRFRDKRTKQMVKIKKVLIKCPSKELADAYEAISEIKKNTIHMETKEIITKEIKNKRKDWGKPLDIRPWVEAVLSNQDKFKATNRITKKKFISKDLIANEFNIGKQTAGRVIAAVLNEL